jgi:hypothetical protein
LRRADLNIYVNKNNKKYKQSNSRDPIVGPWPRAAPAKVKETGQLAGLRAHAPIHPSSKALKKKKELLHVWY